MTSRESADGNLAHLRAESSRSLRDPFCGIVTEAWRKDALLRGGRKRVSGMSVRCSLEGLPTMLLAPLLPSGHCSVSTGLMRALSSSRCVSVASQASSAEHKLFQRWLASVSVAHNRLGTRENVFIHVFQVPRNSRARSCQVRSNLWLSLCPRLYSSRRQCQAVPFSASLSFARGKLAGRYACSRKPLTASGD